MTEDFYELTENGAIDLYNRGIIDTAAVLYFLILIHQKNGQVEIYEEMIRDRLGISKEEFCNAIVKLRDVEEKLRHETS